MDKEDILLLTDKGLAVFKYYIPFSFKLGRNFGWEKTFLIRSIRINGLRVTCIMNGTAEFTS